jgi:DegT/DnrJ/EryC1/StrS aminotransferase family protein
MDGIQAAVLNVKMNYIECWTEARRSVAAQYDRTLSNLPFEYPQPSHHCRHVYHVYAIRLPYRDEALRILHEAGIAVSIHYVNLQKRYVALGHSVGDLPDTERLANEFLSLPIFPELLPEQVAQITSELRKIALLQTPQRRGISGEDVSARPDRLIRGEPLAELRAASDEKRRLRRRARIQRPTGYGPDFNHSLVTRTIRPTCAVK